MRECGTAIIRSLNSKEILEVSDGIAYLGIFDDAVPH
jgi:hypothetical protein